MADAPFKTTQWYRWRARAFSLAIILAVTLVLLELGVRLLPFVVSDPLRSLILESQRIPYSNVRLVSGGNERNGILLPPRQDAEIVVVGDSFPFGTYEKTEDIFPSLLEGKIHKRVINLGIGSQSPPVYNRMVEVGAQYRPKLFYYCLFANDFIYSPLPVVRELKLVESERDRDDDSLLFTRTVGARQRLASWVKAGMNQLMAYQFYKVFAQPFAKHNTQYWTDGVLSFVFPPKQYWDRMVGWQSSEVQAGWRVNIALIQEAHRFAKTTGSQFLVVLQPSKEMVYGPYVGEMGPRIYDEAHYQTYQELARHLSELKIGVVDLTPSLRARAAKKEGLYHVIDGHFNRHGHEVTAEILAERYRALFPASHQ